MMSIVVERLDESLVVASHYMEWSLADVIVVAPRKSLSSHPPPSAWPKEVLERLHKKAEDYGEYTVYNAARKKLDERITHLQQEKKANIAAEVVLLRSVRTRVGSLCLQDEYLERYKAYLGGKTMSKDTEFSDHGDTTLHATVNTNKLRDSDSKFTDKGYTFDFNHEKLFTYDVCGPCEAHAILLKIDKKVYGSTDMGNINGIIDKDEIDALVIQQPLLKDLNRDQVKGNPNFANCPVGIK